MTLIVKHKIRKNTKRIMFHFGGTALQFSGYINATNLTDRQKEHLVKKMGYVKVEEKDYSSISPKIIRWLKIPMPVQTVEVKSTGYKVKPCKTEGCNNQIKFGIKSGDHLRQYCDVCKAIRDEKAA
jgi:hypothetical protein